MAGLASGRVQEGGVKHCLTALEYSTRQWNIFYNISNVVFAPIHVLAVYARQQALVTVGESIKCTRALTLPLST